MDLNSVPQVVELPIISKKQAILTKTKLIECLRELQELVDSGLLSNTVCKDRDKTGMIWTETGIAIINAFIPRGELFCKKLSDIIEQVPSIKGRKQNAQASYSRSANQGHQGYSSKTGNKRKSKP